MKPQEIKFNRKLYSRLAIERAIKAYKGLADFTLSQKGEYFCVLAANINSEVAANFDKEFANYVLGLTVAAFA